MSLILAVVLSASITGAPSVDHKPRTILPPSVARVLSVSDRLIAMRLEAFILKKQQRKEVKLYAARLAESIVLEARRNQIPVAVFAAISWAESWFWWKTKGTSHEFGCFQVWPYGEAVAQEWNVLRKEGRIGTFPNKRWKALGYKTRHQVLQNVEVSAALAARILRRLLRWCKARHRVHGTHLLGSRRHKYEIDRAAHYNSGTAWPKPVYYFQLRRYTRKLQLVLAGK